MEIEWLQNLRAGRPQQPFTATWRNEEVRMDLTLLNPVDRLLVADAPGWRSDTGEQLHAPPVQQILAERRGDTDLASRYAAVITPYVEESPVHGARLLLDDPATGALAVAVEREGCTDYILSAPDGGAHDLGPVSMTGRFGFASVDDEGILRRAFLLCGTSLRGGGRSLRPGPGADPTGCRLGGRPHLPPRRTSDRAGGSPGDLAPGGGHGV